MTLTPMNAASTEIAGRLAEIRALNRHLVSVEDAKILKVVAMVDALPQRGAADTLIAPLRPRLAQLRPSRPLGAPRLLFIPLDPVLVPAAHWRRGELTIPRTAVPCLARQVAALDPTFMEAVAREVAGASTADKTLTRRVGARLWPRAAEVLAGAPMPADWVEATGLTATDHATIRAAVVPVLRHARAVVAQIGASPPDAAVIAAVFADVAGEPEALGVLISVILHWLPEAAAQVLRITSAHSAPTGLPGRNATERAVDHVLDRIETEQGEMQGGVAGLPELRRSIAMLDELETGSTDRPTRRTRIAATRGRIDVVCRGRFQALLQGTVTDRLAQGMPQTAHDVAALETAARDVRRFEQVARRISGSDHYDQQLRSLISDLVPDSADDPQARIDRLRLAEVLLGSERAMQMLLGTGQTAAGGSDTRQPSR